MPAKYYTDKSKKKSAPANSVSAKNTNSGGVPQKSVLTSQNETALDAKARGIPFGPTPGVVEPQRPLGQPSFNYDTQPTTAQPTAPLDLANKNNPFLVQPPGLPQPAAPGQMGKDIVEPGSGRIGQYDKNGNFIETGSASVITPEDLNMLVPGGGFGAGIVAREAETTATNMLGGVLKHEGGELLKDLAENIPKDGVIKEGVSISVKARNLITSLFYKETVLQKPTLVKDWLTGEITQLSRGDILKTNRVAAYGITGAIAVVVAGISSWSFNYFQKAEAIDKAQGAQREVEKIASQMGLLASNYTEYQQASQLVDDTIAEGVSIIPGSGSKFNVETALKGKKIVDAAMKDLAIANATGETPDAMWARINGEKDAAALKLSEQKNAAFELSNARAAALDLEKSRIQNEEFNSSRIAGEIEITKIKEGSQARLQRERLKQIEEEAKFWEEYKKNAIKMEEEQMKAEGEYWLAYRKQLLKLQEDSGRSHLGFGLVR